MNLHWDKWKSLGDNVVTREGNRSNKHYLIINGVTELNEGWYGCFGQYSDVHFVSLGYLRVVG